MHFSSEVLANDSFKNKVQFLKFIAVIVLICFYTIDEKYLKFKLKNKGLRYITLYGTHYYTLHGTRYYMLYGTLYYALHGACYYIL